MTDAAFALRAAAGCFACARYCPSEADEGVEYAEAAIAALPPSFDPDLVRELVETRDWQLLDMIANELEKRDQPVPSFLVETKDAERPSFPARKRQRKPSIRTLMKQAEKAGKPVSSITTPDGVTLHFGESEGAAESAGNEWDEVLLRHGTH